MQKEVGLQKKNPTWYLSDKRLEENVTDDIESDRPQIATEQQGNNMMVHLFLNIQPREDQRHPYTLQYGAFALRPRELALKIKQMKKYKIWGKYDKTEPN